MAIDIRFQGIVDTLVNIATDKFKGRLAWATNIARMIWYYDANNYGEMARRDVLETFAGGIQDSTITSGQALIAGASGRIQSQDAATFRGTISAAASAHGHAIADVSELQSALDAVAQFDSITWGSRAVTTWIKVGTLRVTSQYGSAAFSAVIHSAGDSAGSGDNAAYVITARLKQQSPMSDPAQFIEVSWSQLAGDASYLFGYVLTADSLSEKEIVVYAKRNAAYVVTLGAILTQSGGFVPSSDVVEAPEPTGIVYVAETIRNHQAIIVDGVQRISSAGAATLASLQASNLSGSGTRPLVADASGNIDDQDAATFRATIGAIGTTGAVSQLLKAQTNNAWSNTGPSTPIFHSYQAVYWDGCKLFSADGATEYGTFNGGSSSTGKESSTPSLSAYPAVTLSGADLQIQRDLAAYLGTLAKPTFLGSGAKFGDGGGVLLFPRVGASSAFPGIATGYGNAPISGGGALVACFVDDDTDQDNTTAPATWNVNEFRVNASLTVATGRSELADATVAEAFGDFSVSTAIAYGTGRARWRYTGTGGHTLTLPNSAGGGNIAPTAFDFCIVNNGTGVLTIAVGHASHSINGASSIRIYPEMSVTVHAMSTTKWAIIAGAPAVTREFSIQSLPITNAAPGVVTLGPSGNMKSFGFDGGTQVEEMFYHIDVNHNYIAGTDAVPHIHWVQATNGTGTVRFNLDVQWVESGAAVPAPTTYPCPDVNANGTAWASEQRSEVTVPGAGFTYNSRLILRVYRDPSLDTYTGDVVLTSIGVHYLANPLQIG